MAEIPTDPTPDATLALLRDGYGFVSRRCDRLGADAFRTRLMLRPVLCARGPDAARAFYTPGRFTRVGAMPAITLRLLQDKGSVQGLDGDAHRHRKAMFLDILLDDAQVERLVALTRKELTAAIPHWTLHQPIELTREMTFVLTRVGFGWAGIPLPDEAAATADLAAMVANAATGSAIDAFRLRSIMAPALPNDRVGSIVRPLATGVTVTVPSGTVSTVVVGRLASPDSYRPL